MEEVQTKLEFFQDPVLALFANIDGCGSSRADRTDREKIFQIFNEKCFVCRKADNSDVPLTVAHIVPGKLKGPKHNIYPYSYF